MLQRTLVHEHDGYAPNLRIGGDQRGVFCGDMWVRCGVRKAWDGDSLGEGTSMRELIFVKKGWGWETVGGRLGKVSAGHISKRATFLLTGRHRGSLISGLKL